MKQKMTEKRVINIPKIHFDMIKEYCDTNALSMPKWVTRVALEKMIVDDIVIKTVYDISGEEAAKTMLWDMYKKSMGIGCEKQERSIIHGFK